MVEMMHVWIEFDELFSLKFNGVQVKQTCNTLLHVKSSMWRDPIIDSILYDNTQWEQEQHEDGLQARDNVERNLWFTDLLGHVHIPRTFMGYI